MVANVFNPSTKPTRTTYCIPGLPKLQIHWLTYQQVYQFSISWRAGNITRWHSTLSSMCKASSSIPNTAGKNKEERNQLDSHFMIQLGQQQRFTQSKAQQWSLRFRIIKTSSWPKGYLWETFTEWTLFYVTVWTGPWKSKERQGDY